MELPILMHRAEMHQGKPRIWLLAGTGEGPPLAKQLLAEGWQVQLSLVSGSAALPYVAHPNLDIRIGALGGDGAIGQMLEQAQARGNSFAAVVDASHPFARQISADLAKACMARQQPLLRLLRPSLEGPGQIQLQANLEALADYPWHGERLLWAIGARQLAKAIGLSKGAVHHARILPTPTALQQAMASGLGEGQLACLRPAEPTARWEDSIEAALLRQWGITVVVARQSGGITEASWRAACAGLGVKLLLLQRPPEPPGVECLLEAELLARLAGIKGLFSPDAGPANPAGSTGA
ncbi:precorrin-6A/cobalt-precorrin-6A reductase [Cyanobium sp. WAJ14-Wanaka]|uniref:precorrin-6A/cobalt-precorrin-6A reductase n=1 Tax=Cyanobium sp. WAJ14-Wanaka TaxID=2823725 RepID=UPI0020CC803C|nr:precorrin-6A/cobalt-precorrin-6A reductase [Cyanobium sp. WAJ14-Wanaka]MCP9774741.1 precorrin-6A/cobalt-precorrin-6A reductase [Cyanobium sp. WAJ14-Wanaka]